MNKKLLNEPRILSTLRLEWPRILFSLGCMNPVKLVVWWAEMLLAVGRWFPPGTLVSSTRKLISSFRLDMTLAVAEALNPNKPKPTP